MNNNHIFLTAFGANPTQRPQLSSVLAVAAQFFATRGMTGAKQMARVTDGYAADGDVLEPTWQAGPQDKAALAIQARVRGNSTRKDLELHPTAGGSRTGGIPAETAAEVATRKQMAVFEAEAAQRETAAGSLQRAERARAAKRVATRKDTDAKWDGVIRGRAIRRSRRRPPHACKQ
ncbi:hypothetical protein T492DRAFT_843276 [Pavlovales sp. CCMP2436]|nr:hypothetical protein T492DRAFT_843276 [Pavlovales sp. CCMP2436]